MNYKYPFLLGKIEKEYPWKYTSRGVKSRPKLSPELVIGTDYPYPNPLAATIVVDGFQDRTGDAGHQQNRVKIRVNVRLRFLNQLQPYLHRLRYLLQQHRHLRNPNRNSIPTNASNLSLRFQILRNFSRKRIQTWRPPDTTIEN